MHKKIKIASPRGAPEPGAQYHGITGILVNPALLNAFWARVSVLRPAFPVWIFFVLAHIHHIAIIMAVHAILLLSYSTWDG